MYEVIEAAEGIDESSVPSSAYVPSADGSSHNSILGSQSNAAGGYAVNAGAGGIGGGHTVFDADEAHVAPTAVLPAGSVRKDEKASAASAGEF